MKSRYPSSLYSVLVVVVACSTIGISLESIHQNIVEWLSATPAAGLLTALIASMSGLTLLALFGRALPATLLAGGALGVLHVAHATKTANTGKPLFPWEVFLFREGLNLADYTAGKHQGWVIAVVLLIAAAFSLWKLRPVRMRARVGLLVFTTTVWAGVAVRPALLASQLGIVHLVWVQSENSRINGMLLAFVLNTPSAAVVAPSGYTREKVQQVVAGIPPGPRTPETPSVVVVMSESFFDPTTLPGVTFDEDPLPNLRRLQRTSAAGTLFPPVFGGGTANTEFEFLTSHSMRFLPTGSIPYQQYVRRDQRSSLPRIFRNAGYRTVAIHTYHRWFWEREQVYRHLGFENFVGLEDMEGLLYDGAYPSDAELTQRIISEVAKTDQPMFVFAVSMEAHGPYLAGRYRTSNVRFTAELDAEGSQELTTYVEAISHADRELGKLVDYFETSGRPTVVVFFGDHQPALTNVYQQLGLMRAKESLDSMGSSHFLKLHQVPLVIWSNTETVPADLGSLSPVFLGPTLLDLTGTRGTRYTDFVRNAKERTPVILPRVITDASGTVVPQQTDGVDALVDAWWTLEYDALFGDDFLNDLNDEGDESLGG